MPQDSQKTVLLVDDDHLFREQLGRALTRRGWNVHHADNAVSASAAAHREHPEYAVVDLRLGQDNGLHVVEALLAHDPATVVVVFTGYGSIATAVTAMRMGARHYLTKPADVDELLAAFERAQLPPKVAAALPVPEVEAPSLARTEWEHINRVLEDHQGNVSAAARALGMHRRSLQRKLAKRPASR